MADNALFEPSAGVPGAAPTNALLAAPPSMADAYEYHAQALQKWMAEQRAGWAETERAEMADGRRDPTTGELTPAGMGQAAFQAAMGLSSGGLSTKAVGPALADAVTGKAMAGFRAYHGSPHSFDAFDLGKIGTGEGAQAYGHGLYFADNEGVARSYRDALAPLGTQTAQGGTGAEGMAARALQRAKSPEEAAASLDYNLTVHKAANDGKIDPNFQAQIQEARRLILNPGARGHMYEVQVNADPAHFLDWDKPRDQQPPNVQAFAQQQYPRAWANAADGSSLYQHMVKQAQSEYPGATKGYNPPPGFNAHAIITDEMAKAGIPGIRYLDGGSRADGTGTSNHVIFDANTIAILRKYGIAGLIAGGGAAATQTPRQEPSP